MGKILSKTISEEKDSYTPYIHLNILRMTKRANKSLAYKSRKVLTEMHILEGY